MCVYVNICIYKYRYLRGREGGGKQTLIHVEKMILMKLYMLIRKLNIVTSCQNCFDMKIWQFLKSHRRAARWRGLTCILLAQKLKSSHAFLNFLNFENRRAARWRSAASSPRSTRRLHESRDGYARKRTTWHRHVAIDYILYIYIYIYYIYMYVYVHTYVYISKRLSLWLFECSSFARLIIWMLNPSFKSDYSSFVECLNLWICRRPAACSGPCLIFIDHIYIYIYIYIYICIQLFGASEPLKFARLDVWMFELWILTSNYLLMFGCLNVWIYRRRAACSGLCLAPRQWLPRVTARSPAVPLPVDPLLVR
jgi:hypothetical protein